MNNWGPEFLFIFCFVCSGVLWEISFDFVLIVGGRLFKDEACLSVVHSWFVQDYHCLICLLF